MGNGNRASYTLNRNFSLGLSPDHEKKITFERNYACCRPYRRLCNPAQPNSFAC